MSHELVPRQAYCIDPSHPELLGLEDRPHRAEPLNGRSELGIGAHHGPETADELRTGSESITPVLVTVHLRAAGGPTIESDPPEDERLEAILRFAPIAGVHRSAEPSVDQPMALCVELMEPIKIDLSPRPTVPGT